MIIYAVDDEKLALELLADAINEAVPDANLCCFNNPNELLNESRKTSPDIVFFRYKYAGNKWLVTC